MSRYQSGFWTELSLSVVLAVYAILAATLGVSHPLATAFLVFGPVIAGLAKGWQWGVVVGLVGGIIETVAAQFETASLFQRSNIYHLGMTVFYMLSGAGMGVLRNTLLRRERMLQALYRAACELPGQSQPENLQNQTLELLEPLQEFGINPQEIAGEISPKSPPSPIWTRQRQRETAQLAQSFQHLINLVKAENQAKADLSAAREESIRALGLALEYRDFETKGHTDRVTTMALALGHAASLNPQELKELQIGAYLHDVGKIAIPDNILLKPGRLDASEWETMKSHVLVGEKLAHELIFLPPSAPLVIRSHHERYDGQGYPDGLPGESIPLYARIFSLADVYDALTSARPYKEAWPPDKAISYIQENAGTQFDPELSELFLRIVFRYANFS